MSPHSIASPPTREFVAFVLLGFLFLHPLPGASQQTVTLAGQVQGVGGTIIHSVVNLRLETPEGALVEHEPARTGGQFEFVSVRKASYRLTVTADGYQTFSRAWI